jgi:hypothetical protein
VSVGALETLVDSLLYEGYALYPYTPGATKNSTPTPFGIVYPPAYADGRFSFDHIQLECLLEKPGDVTCEVRFLQAAGERHEGTPRRLQLAAGEVSASFSLDSLEIALSLSVDGGRVTLRVENRTEVDAGLTRAEALRRSLISTHPILRVDGGRFMSPLDAGLRSVNTFPVLASDADDVIVGAAFVLPDHPTLAPESLGGLFDSTEIEEALLLHVQVLSDEERAAIEAGDPKVREMVERAESATSDDILALHGRLTLQPPTPSAAVKDPTRGEERAEAEGKVFTRGGKVILRPPADADLHARMAAGRTATVERIFVDLDGKVHLGVTIDGDPGQELMRETNRLLFFFAPEVEVVA